MDRQDIGAFIQKLRKEKGLTQKELADGICVSDKTISKWENGNSVPDTSILLSLCRKLDVSVNELLNCERIPPEDYSKKAEVTIMNLIQENQNNRKYGKTQYIFGMAFLIITAAMFILGGPANLAWYLDIPSFLILACGCAAAAFLSGKRGRGEVVRVLRKAVFPIGALVALVSVVAALRFVTAPELIAPNLSTAIIVLIYSCIAYLVFLLLEQHWNKKESKGQA